MKTDYKIADYHSGFGESVFDSSGVVLHGTQGDIDTFNNLCGQLGIHSRLLYMNNIYLEA